MDGLATVLANFDITGSFSFSTTDGAFNKNWIVSTNLGKFVLKRRPFKSIERSITECELSLFLVGKLPTAKPIKALKSGYVYKGKEGVYSLFKFVKGERYRDTVDNLKAVAKSMAVFHKKTLRYSGKTAFRTNAIGWCKSLLKDYIGTDKEVFRKIANVCINNLSKAANNLPKTVIHWDIHAGNLLISKKTAIFFDFEFAHKDYRIMDLGNTLTLLAALNPEEIDYGDAISFIQKCELDLEKANTLVSEYCKFNALNNIELNHIADAMSLAWVSWCLYTFNQLRPSERIAQKALYFPRWVDRNRKYIANLID